MLGTATIILGFGVGLAFGYVSQRGRFCMLSVVYEIVNGRAPDMLRAYLLAVAIQMVAVNVLAHYGLVQTTIPPFFGMATVAGGIFSAWAWCWASAAPALSCTGSERASSIISWSWWAMPSRRGQATTGW